MRLADIFRRRRPGIIERRIFFFKCRGCGKDKRRTFFGEKADKKLCKNCRGHEVDPNQMPLIEKRK